MSLEQSQIDLVQYRLQKSQERIEAAERLFEFSLYGDSIGRSYYAIFTAARAFLALMNLDSQKHSGIISFFNRYCIKPKLLPRSCSVILTDAKRDREASDYNDYVEFSREDAETQLKQAKEFLQLTKGLINKIISGEVELPKKE